MFSSQEYSQRRQALKKAVASGIILLPANNESSINYKDNWYPYRQDSTFLYYVGIQMPQIFVALDADSGEEILFGNEVTPEEMVWIGAADPLQVTAAKSAIAIVKPLKELPAYLQQAKGKGQTIHYLPPYRADTLITLGDLLNENISTIKAEASHVLIMAVAAQRSIKSDLELEELHKAVNTTAAMHTYAIQHGRAGVTEKEIAGALQAIAIKGGGNIAFPIILTTNGQYLHNHATENRLEKGDLVLCDAGAENASGYAGDMTRTFPVSERFTDLQREVYNIVLNAHETAISALQPGTLFKDIHLLACTQLASGLKDLGIMKGDVHESVANGAHTLFFQCGLGHMMGMDVHDMENLGEANVGYTPSLQKSTAFGLKSLRLGKALEERYVLTVEPGLYFNPFLIEEWKSKKQHLDFIDYKEAEKFTNFGGIRVEEDFVITATGAQLLGDPLAKTASAIEELKNA